MAKTLFVSIAPVLASLVGRYVHHILVWKWEQPILSILFCCLILISLLFLIYYTFTHIVFAKESVPRKIRAEMPPLKKPKYSPLERSVAVVLTLLSLCFFVIMIESFYAFLSFRREVAVGELHIVKTDRAKEQPNFFVFVQNFEGRSVRKDEINFTNRIYERLLEEIQNTKLPIQIDKNNVLSKDQINTLVSKGVAVFTISGWYDDYDASITIKQDLPPHKKPRFYPSPDKLESKVIIGGPDLEDPREWKYFVRIGAEKQVTYVVMHLIGKILLMDEETLLYGVNYEEAFRQVFTVFAIANKNLPRKVNWFGLYPKTDPKLRLEILYNDIGRAHYVRALRTGGPYMRDEQKESDKNWQQFIRKQLEIRFDNLLKAKEHFERSYSMNQEFLPAFANSFRINFHLWINGFPVRWAPTDDIEEIERLLSTKNLQDEDKKNLEGLLRDTRQIMKFLKPEAQGR